MSNAEQPNELTTWLQRWSEGDGEALEHLLPLVYDECRRIAAWQMRRERAGHTLTPTALVHEMYLRFAGQRNANWKNRTQFYCVAGKVMRRILVDHARARQTRKRGASPVLVTLDAVPAESVHTDVADVLAIDSALRRLAQLDPDQERIVELRFFAGLTVEETAELVGRSPRTIKREWQLAKAWLFRELKKGEAGNLE